MISHRGVKALKIQNWCQCFYWDFAARRFFNTFLFFKLCFWINLFNYLWLCYYTNINSSTRGTPFSEFAHNNFLAGFFFCDLVNVCASKNCHNFGHHCEKLLTRKHIRSFVQMVSLNLSTLSTSFSNLLDILGI